MTYAARQVLDHCKGALEDLTEEGIHGGTFVRRWTAAIALLRASMHVLDKVDATSSPELAKVNATAWARLKSDKSANSIFFEFIESERNLVLKQGRFGASQVYRVNYDENGDPLVEHLYYMNVEPFKGRDPRDVLEEAINWLEDYLNKIDAELYQALPIGHTLERIRGVGTLFNLKGEEVCKGFYKLRVIHAEHGTSRGVGIVKLSDFQRKLTDSSYILVTDDSKEYVIGLKQRIPRGAHQVVFRPVE